MCAQWIGFALLVGQSASAARAIVGGSTPTVGVCGGRWGSRSASVPAAVTPPRGDSFFRVVRPSRLALQARAYNHNFPYYVMRVYQTEKFRSLANAIVSKQSAVR